MIMAKPIEQVEQDLTKLRMASSQLGQELLAVYKSYFASLAPILKKQSIQGCYYLCTNAYPESFLKLTFDRKSQLLKTLQRVINNAVANLVVQIEPSNRVNDDDEPTGELTPIPTMPTDWFATPTSLSTWQQQLEEKIRYSLKEISYKVNLLLQQGQVLPQSIPKPLLEANLQADRQGGSIMNIPNLLSVSIEQEDPQAEELIDREEDEVPNILAIHTLYLRLTEVEFSDGTVLSCRKNINQLVNKIGVLQREYLQKQQELKIAEAESAWRNSWFED
jgi:hypothetical protein